MRNDADRTPRPAYIQHNVLKSITYPTGGRTEFTFEPNNFSYERDLPLGTTESGSGLRIKQILYKDSNDKLLKGYSYNYGTGHIPVRPDQADYNTLKTYIANVEESIYALWPHQVWTDRRTRVTPRWIPYVSMDGDAVRYENVEEVILDGTSTLGKTVSYYDVPNTAEYITSFKNENEVPNGYRDYHFRHLFASYKFEDLLLKVETYDNNGNLKKKITNEYSRNNNEPLMNMFIYKLFYYTAPSISCSFTDRLQDYEIMYIIDYEYNSYFSLLPPLIYSYYTVYTGTDNLASQTTEYYYDTKTYSEQKTYQYNYTEANSFYPRKIFEKNSKGGFIENRYKYVYDYNDPIASAMGARNIIAPVMEQKIYGTNGSSSFLKESIYSSYNAFTSGAQTLYRPNIISYASGDNIPEIKLQYTNYDQHGKIEQFNTNDGILHSIIWSYNGDKAVVKGDNVATNILKSAVESAAGTTDLETFWKGFNDIATDAAQQTAWNSFNTALRNNASLANSHLTTYTYTPLIGITSQTDPNGVTTYYEYDSFGRLKTTTDNNNKVTGHYKYHYAGQPAPPSGTTLSLSTSCQSFGVYGGSITVSVTCNTFWSISGVPTWLTVGPSSGSGSGSFTITAGGNTGALRTATITVTANGINRSIVIEQAGNGEPPFDFTLSSLPWTYPSHLVGQEYNPLVYYPSEISLWYNFSYYDTNNYENVQLEANGDPNPVSVDIWYYNNMGWIDFYYDDVNNRLVFGISNPAPQTDYAVIAVTAQGVTKRISVSVNY